MLNKNKISNGVKAPGFLSKYFWDVDFNNLNIKTDPFFIIERVLEYGNERAVKWILDNFSNSQIKQTLSKRRSFSKKSANYWSLILGIPKSKILCLDKSYQKMQKIHWPY